MAYTGKAHPELASGPNEIIFTFVANTPGVVYPLFEEGADVLYVPRFVRLTFHQGGKEEMDEQGQGIEEKKGRKQHQQHHHPRQLRTRRRRKRKQARESAGKAGATPGKATAGPPQYEE